MRSNRITFAIALLGALVVTFGLFAQSAAFAKEPPEEALALAKELMHVTKADKTAEMMMMEINKNYTDALTKANPGKGKAVADLLNQVVFPEFRKTLPQMTEALTDLYARNFTVSELKEILAFYDSATGRKVIEKMPVVLREGRVIGQQWARSVMARVNAKLQEAIKKQGLKKPQGI